MNAFASKLIARVGLVVASHYVGLLPLALFGAWVNYLIPSLQWFLVLPHLILMAIMTLFGVDSAKLFFAPVILLVTSAAFTYPQWSVILRDLDGDWGRFIVGWTGPIAYLILSSVAFFLFNRRFRSWAETELARARG